MSRHPAARRRRQSGPESDDDKFVHGVLETSAWARQNARMLVIAGAVVAALVIGFFVYRNYSAARETGAANALNDLRTTAAAGNVQLAMRDGEDLIARYGRTEAADEARLMLGEMYLQVNQPQQAAEVLAPISRDINAPLGFNAALLIGGAQEASGQVDLAVQTYTRIGRTARFLYQQVAGYEEAARAQTAAGDPAAAISSYDRILALLDENSTERGFYEMRIAELATGGVPPNAAPPQPLAADAGAPPTAAPTEPTTAPVDAAADTTD